MTTTTPRPPRLRAALLALFAVSALVPAPARGDEPSDALIFTSFRGNGEDGLHLAASEDGYTWTALKDDRPFLTSKVGGGLMRDPCLIAGPDGAFHLVWTTAWNQHGIGHARSTDLIHWSEPRLLDVMKNEPEARNVWAPEIVYDQARAQYLILWSSTIPGRFPATEKTGDDGYNHRLYAATTADFETVSPARLFFDPGRNSIDGTIARDDAGDQFLLFFKDETRTPPAKTIHLATSRDLMGPYAPPLSPPITGNYWAEGPTAVKIGSRWHVYFDRYVDHRYGLVVSDDLVHWRDESDRVQFPPDFRHGSVLRVPAAVLQRLRAERPDEP